MHNTVCRPPIVQLVMVQLAFSNHKNIRIQLMNTIGQRLQITDFEQVRELNTSFSMTNYAASIYFLQIVDMDTQQVLTRRVVKQ